MQRYKLRSFIATISFLVVLLPFIGTGCDSESRRNPARVEVNTLNDLINALELFSLQWESALEDTIADLDAAETPLSLEIANDLRLVLDECVTMFETPSLPVFLCSLDFAGIYAKQRAMEIRHDHWPKYPLPDYSPVVCDTQPQDVIEVGDEFLLYLGHNFLNNTKTFSANIEYYDGEIVIEDLPLDIPNDNEIWLDLRNIDMTSASLDLTRSPRIVLRWEEGKSEMLIIVTD